MSKCSLEHAVKILSLLIWNFRTRHRPKPNFVSEYMVRLLATSYSSPNFTIFLSFSYSHIIVAVINTDYQHSVSAGRHRDRLQPSYRTTRFTAVRSTYITTNKFFFVFESLLFIVAIHVRFYINTIFCLFAHILYLCHPLDHTVDVHTDWSTHSSMQWGPLRHIHQLGCELHSSLIQDIAPLAYRKKVKRCACSNFIT